MENTLVLDGLDFSYPNNPAQPVLAQLDLTVRPGEFVCLIGRSGCGKSTLLNLTAGLLEPKAGSITLGGRPVTTPGTDRAVVFQHYSLFPWMTAKRNISFGVRQAKPGLSRRQADEIAGRWLEQVDLWDARDKYPYQLSGGMQQRVAIARALAMDSDTLLLDEPFGALDTRMRIELQQLLMQLLVDAPDKKVLFVTHDISEAIFLADRVVYMENGRIVEDIPVDFPRPRLYYQLRHTREFGQIKTLLLGHLGAAGGREGEGGADESIG